MCAIIIHVSLYIDAASGCSPTKHACPLFISILVLFTFDLLSLLWRSFDPSGDAGHLEPPISFGSYGTVEASSSHLSRNPLPSAIKLCVAFDTGCRWLPFVLPVSLLIGDTFKNFSTPTSQTPEFGFLDFLGVAFDRSVLSFTASLLRFQVLRFLVW